MLRDSEGFLILAPKKRGPGRPKKSDSGSNFIPVDIRSSIGKYSLDKLNEKTIYTDRIDNSDSFNLPLRYHSMYCSPFRPKSWEHKAFGALETSIDWNRPAPFRKHAGSKQLRHTVGIAVSIDVYILRGSAKLKRVDQFKLYPDDKKYVIATSEREIKRLLYAVHDFMSYESVKRYERDAISLNGTSLHMVNKMMIAYDDGSVDTLNRNPMEIFSLLKIKFDGRKILL